MYAVYYIWPDNIQLTSNKALRYIAARDNYHNESKFKKVHLLVLVCGQQRMKTKFCSRNNPTITHMQIKHYISNCIVTNLWLV